MPSIKNLRPRPMHDLLTDLKFRLPIPTRLYINRSSSWTDKTKMLTTLPDIIPQLHFAELHRRDQSLLSSSEKFTWDTYVKAIIVPGPVGGDLVSHGQAAYRAIAAWDVPGQGKRSRETGQWRLAQRLEVVTNSCGEELAEARMKLHAGIRLGVGEHKRRAMRRFKDTMRLRVRDGYWDGGAGRGGKERMCQSR